MMTLRLFTLHPENMVPTSDLVWIVVTATFLVVVTCLLLEGFNGSNRN
jgi:hypothetical protein